MQQLTTWADTRPHLLPVKSSMILLLRLGLGQSNLPVYVPCRTCFSQVDPES